MSLLSIIFPKQPNVAIVLWLNFADLLIIPLARVMSWLIPFSINKKAPCLLSQARQGAYIFSLSHQSN